METTGLKEEDSSVEIYVEKRLTEEARHEDMQDKDTHRRDEYEHMHVTNGTAQVKAQTTETQKTRVNTQI